MALAQVIDVPQQKKGSLLSKIFGGGGAALGVLGAIAAIPTGGASLAAAAGLGAATAPSLAAAGSAASLAGGLMQPTSSGNQPANVPQLDSAASRRLGNDPNATLAQMHEGMAALQQEDAQTRAAYEPFLNAAISAQKGRVI